MLLLAACIAVPLSRKSGFGSVSTIRRDETVIRKYIRDREHEDPRQVQELASDVTARRVSTCGSIRRKGGDRIDHDGHSLSHGGPTHKVAVQRHVVKRANPRRPRPQRLRSLLSTADAGPSASTAYRNDRRLAVYLARPMHRRLYVTSGKRRNGVRMSLPVTN